MPSFDVVSEVDLQEVDNALTQANRELTQRYDFKGTETKVEFGEGSFKLESADEYKVKAATEVLEAKLAKRGVALASLDHGKIEDAAGGRARQIITLKLGIDKETAKKIVKDIKSKKFKVQVAIQGDSLRVSGKKRDDLQDVMADLKAGNWGLPLQFENFRD